VRKSTLSFWFEALTDLIFPPYCLNCKRRLPVRQLPLLCNDCGNAIPYITSPYCLCCGKPFSTGKDHLCGACLNDVFLFNRARSALSYSGRIPFLICAFKYGRDLSTLSSLAFIATQSRAYKELKTPDIIIPVPLHKKRLQQRGFNQALLLAQAIFPQWKKRIDYHALVRHQNTIAQTNLNHAQRKSNVSGAFLVKNPKMVESRRILLVDDVFTTGSTANECSKNLLSAGATEVEVFTLARVIKI